MTMQDQPSNLTLQAKVREARARAQKRETIDLEIPGYAGTLWGRFRALDDYSEAREIGMRHQRVKDPADMELAIAVDTLLTCCVDCFVPSDDGEFSLKMKLGVDLARWLDVEGSDREDLTDHQAVHLIVPNSLQLADLARRAGEFSTDTGVDTDRGLQGN